MSNDIDTLEERCERAEERSRVLTTVLEAVVEKIGMECPLDHTPEQWEDRTCAWCGVTIPKVAQFKIGKKKP